MVIRKQGSNYVLYSRKTHRKLGTFRSRVAAVKRERQIQFFKNRSDRSIKGGR